MPQFDQSALDVLILGGGIAGITVALALSKYTTNAPKITVVEIRAQPSTIGGAVNLTPNALRYLAHVGVLKYIRNRSYGADVLNIDLFDIYYGTKYSEVSFRGPRGDGYGTPPYRALRIKRAELLQALLEAASKHDNIEILYGRKTINISENDDHVSLTFTDGTCLSGDILIGADGIHSGARSLLIEPDRNPVYSGIAIASSFSAISQELKTRIPWQDTALISSRRGSLMTTYYSEARDSMSIGAVMETSAEGIQSREGWKAKGADQQAVRDEILERFAGSHSAMPVLRDLIERAGDWYLYPVFKLPPKGKWVSPKGKCILIGDAAHAMPPQGESTGIALEDAIVLARTLTHHESHPIAALFSKYESLRRIRIDAAYDEANFRWETVKDSGWLGYNMKKWLTPWVLWWSQKTREKAFVDDLAEMDVSI